MAVGDYHFWQPQLDHTTPIEPRFEELKRIVGNLLVEVQRLTARVANLEARADATSRIVHSLSVDVPKPTVDGIMVRRGDPVPTPYVRVGWCDPNRTDQGIG